MGNFDTMMKIYSEDEYENNLMSYIENISDKILVPDLKPIDTKMNLKFGIYTIKIENNEITDHGLLHYFSIIAADKSNVEVILGLLYYLGKIHHKKAMNLLLSKLQDDNEAVIAQALYSLGNLKFVESCPGILEVLFATESIKVKSEAIWALGKIKDNDSIHQTLEFLDIEPLRAVTISALGKSRNSSYSKQLRPYLESTEEDILIRSIVSLGKINDIDSVPTLIAMLKKEYPASVYSTIIYTLGELRSERALKPFIECLREGKINEDIILSAFFKIGYAGTDLLIQSLQDDDLYIKTCSAKLLGDIGDKKAVPALVATLHDDDVFVVDEVITALGKIGDKGAITNLLEIFNTDNMYIKDRVKDAMAKIGNSKVFSALVSNTDLENDKIDEIMDLFNELGTDKTQILIDSIKDPDNYVRIPAIQILQKLNPKEVKVIISELLKDEDANARQTIVKVIRELSITNLDNELTNALKLETNETVIMELVWTIGELQVVDAIDTLFTILEMDLYDTILRLRTADAIVKFKEVPLDKIVSMIDSKDEFTKEAATYMLGKVGNTDSIPAIRAMLEDKSPSVVSMAVNSLANIGDHASFDLILEGFNNSKIKEDALSNFIKKIGDNLIPYIPKMIKNKNQAAQIVVRQLGFINSPSIRDLLVYISHELADDYNILKAVILAMSIHGTQRELDVVSTFIYDANVEISSTAIMSMDKIQKKIQK